MKTKLFLVGLLSFFYVNSQVVRLVELPVPDVGITSALSTIFEESATTTAMVEAPANDDCSGAIELTVNSDYACGTVTSATLEDATDSEVEAEVGNPDDDVWFSFIATNTVHKVTLTNIDAGSWEGEDLAMEVMEGSCGTLELVDYSDPNTLIVSGLTVGTAYYVRVFSYYDYVVDTTFDICIGTPPAAPANDECSAAVVLTASATATCETPTSGTLQSATDSGVQAEVGEADDDVWYSFVATSTSHLVALTDVEGDESDLVFEILTGVCDEQEIFKSSDANAALVTGLTSGTTYYLRVFSYGEDNNSDATFKVCVATPGAAPANDECDAAVVLTVNADLDCDVVTPGTLLFATDSGVDTETGTADDDVWFSFTATASVHKISAINIEGSTGDLVIEVFAEGCDGALVESSDPQSFYVTDLNPETVYYVRVFTYSQALSDVTFDLCIGTLPPPPANDECDGAVSLTMNPDYSCGVVTSATLQGATDSGFESETGEADDDVWFSFTATSTSHKISLLDVNAGGWEGYDVAMEVMEGECGGLSILDGTTSSDLVISDLTPETVYYVRVYSTYDNIVDTTFDICVGTTPDAPANDECTEAIVLTANPTMTCTSTASGTLQSATDSGIEAETGEADDDVWYSFVATAETHLISLKNVTGDDTNVVFEVLEGECENPSIIAGNENQIGLVSALNIGSTYFIRVFTYYSDNNPDTEFNICVATPDPAPANDDCDAAVVLTVNPDYNCAVTTAGTIAFATDSGIEAETGEADDDVWYSFTATSDTHKISLSNIIGNVNYLAIEVFEGGCDSSIFASIDEPILVMDDLIEGTVYYVRVYSYYEELAFTTFDICVGKLPLSQPNDECENATVLTVNANGECDVVTTASLASATDSGIEAENGEADDDVWFSFVALGTSQKVTVSEADDFEGLVVEVFSGTCEGTLTLISDEDSAYVDGLTIGNTYYARVFSYEDYPVTSTFDICVALKQPAPANDDCAGAISLNVDAAYCNGVLNNGTNLGSTDSGIDNPDCFNHGENDVWFSFTVPANVASVDISTDFTGGSLVDTEIALYSGSCTNLTEEACDQDSGETNLSNGYSYNSIITDANVTVGETYYVRVSGYSEESEGSFCLEISTNSVLSKEEFTKNTLKAYPNPVKDMLNLSNTTTITDVAIFNLLGQQVVTKAVNANEGHIDMSHLSAGAYLVKVTADNAVQTIKIIKE